MIKFIKENDYSETDEFTLIKEMNHWIKQLKKFFVDDKKAQKAIADYFYYDDGAHEEDFKEFQASVKMLRKLYNKLHNISENAEEKEYKEKNKTESITRYTSDAKNLEHDFRTIYVDDVLDEIDSELKQEGFDLLDDDKCITPKDCRYSKYTDGKFEVIVYYTENDSIVQNVYVKELVKESYTRLHEQDVEIEVKHEGILEVPEGKNVEDLPVSHFVNLAKKKGTGKITKALNNLQVWNKKKNPSLSKWAGDMIDKVNKKMEKTESLRKESYRYYSDLEGLDDTTLDIIRKLDELDYYGIKPIKFGRDTLMSFSKNYFTDKKKSNGVTVDIDPLNGDVTVTEFVYDVDGEDLTDLCPVKKVRTVNDVIKIDRWAKNIRKW